MQVTSMHCILARDGSGSSRNHAIAIYTNLKLLSYTDVFVLLTIPPL